MNGLKRQIEEFVKYSFDKGFFNGTWLVKRKGEVISKGAIGKAHPYTDRPVKIDTIFELASVSKHFTATAIMILRDRDALSLCDPLEKYISGCPYPGITVRNLLNHTSGLPDYMEWVAEYGKKNKTIPQNSIIEKFLLESGSEKLFEPGQGWSYCNTAYSVLAFIIEKASGKNFPDFMKDEIFTPCGMKNSCVYHRRMNGETIENYAYGMVLHEGKYTLPDDIEDENHVIPLDGMEGDGIVNTTVEDMLKWDEAIRAETVLKRASQDEMHTETVLFDGEAHPYGYGWRLMTDPEAGKVAQHGGGWPGYNTTFVRVIDDDAMAVVLCNQTGCDNLARSELLQGFEALVLGRSAKLPASLDEQEDKTVDCSVFPSYCGQFENGVKVYLEGGALKISLVYRETPLDSELVPVGGGLFISRLGNCMVRPGKESVTITLLYKDETFKRVE